MERVVVNCSSGPPKAWLLWVPGVQFGIGVFLAIVAVVVADGTSRATLLAIAIACLLLLPFTLLFALEPILHASVKLVIDGHGIWHQRFLRTQFYAWDQIDRVTGEKRWSTRGPSTDEIRIHLKHAIQGKGHVAVQFVPGADRPIADVCDAIQSRLSRPANPATAVGENHPELRFRYKKVPFFLLLLLGGAIGTAGLFLCRWAWDEAYIARWGVAGGVLLLGLFVVAYACRTLFDFKVQLIVGDSGLVDNRFRPNPLFLPWGQIQSVSLRTMRGSFTEVEAVMELGVLQSDGALRSFRVDLYGLNQGGSKVIYREVNRRAKLG